MWELVVVYSLSWGGVENYMYSDMPSERICEETAKEMKTNDSKTSAYCRKKEK